MQASMVIDSTFMSDSVVYGMAAVRSSRTRESRRPRRKSLPVLGREVSLLYQGSQVFQPPRIFLGFGRLPLPLLLHSPARGIDPRG
jgi:hypothetical protein